MNYLALFSPLLLAVTSLSPGFVVAQHANTSTTECVEYYLIVRQSEDPTGITHEVVGIEPGDCPTISDGRKNRVGSDYFEQYFVAGIIYASIQHPEKIPTIRQELATQPGIAHISQPFLSLDLPEIIKIELASDSPTDTFDIASTLDQRYWLDLGIDFAPRFDRQSFQPNDPLISQQRHLEAIHRYDAVTKCGPTQKPITVAIVDNGFATDHPDLAASISQQYDVADKDSDASVPRVGDGREHGTVEAWLAAAIANNAEGIIWAAGSSAELIVIKSTPDDETGENVTAGLDGIAKAVDLGAEIINLSRGTPIDSRLVQRVIKAATEKGVLIVAAAGNQGSSEPFYPAAYPEVIGVGAVDRDDRRAYFSNYGDRVDIYAPGVDMFSTDLNDLYGSYDGTSEAAPTVAGALAFARAHGKSLEQFLASTRSSPDWSLSAPLLDMKELCDWGTLVSQPIAQHAAPADSPDITVINQPSQQKGLRDIVDKILTYVLLIVILYLIYSRWSFHRAEKDL